MSDDQFHVATGTRPLGSTPSLTGNATSPGSDLLPSRPSVGVRWCAKDTASAAYRGPGVSTTPLQQGSARGIRSHS